MHKLIWLYLSFLFLKCHRLRIFHKFIFHIRCMRKREYVFTNLRCIFVSITNLTYKITNYYICFLSISITIKYNGKELSEVRYVNLNNWFFVFCIQFLEINGYTSIKNKPYNLWIAKIYVNAFKEWRLQKFESIT